MHACLVPVPAVRPESREVHTGELSMAGNESPLSETAFLALANGGRATADACTTNVSFIRCQDCSGCSVRTHAHLAVPVLHGTVLRGFCKNQVAFGKFSLLHLSIAAWQQQIPAQP